MLTSNIRLANFNYRLLFITLLLSLALLALASLTSANEIVTRETQTLTVNGETRTIQMVHIDTRNRQLEVRTEIAQGGIGSTESLASFVQRTGAIAAINGNYFNAYTPDRQPHGNIIINGQLLNSGQSGSTVGFTGNNNMLIANVLPNITGAKNGSWEYPNSWYAWGFNHDTTTNNPGAIIIFTGDTKGRMTIGDNATSVVIRDGVVTHITAANVQVPTNGYVIRIGNSVEQRIRTMFAIGDLVDYRVTYEAKSPSSNLDWSNVRHAMSAGPILIHNGNVSIDFERDNMTDPKIVHDRGFRGFIGSKTPGITTIGVVPNLNMRELASFLQTAGFREAMATDGGASAGISFRGSNIQTPSRELAAALVFVDRGTNLPRVSVNGKELFLDVRAYLDFIGGDRSKGVTMIPVRGVLEETGATVSWDPVRRAVTAVRGDTRVELVIGSATAMVNNQAVSLDLPATIRDDRTFIPIRFVSENLGDTVGWNQEQFMVSITSEHSTGQVSAASILESANQSYANNDYANAISYYEQYLKMISNADDTVYHRLGWASYNISQFDKAVNAFNVLAQRNRAAGYYGLAITYSHSHFSNVPGNRERIISNFRKVIELDPDPNSTNRQTAETRLYELETYEDLYTADQYYANGDFINAIKHYENYFRLASYPEDTAYFRYSWANHNIGAYNKAEAGFEILVSRGNVQGYYGLGRMYSTIAMFQEQPGIIDKIRSNYQKVVQLITDPNNASRQVAEKWLQDNQ